MSARCDSLALSVGKLRQPDCFQFHENPVNSQVSGLAPALLYERQRVIDKAKQLLGIEWALSDLLTQEIIRKEIPNNMSLMTTARRILQRTGKHTNVLVRQVLSVGLVLLMAPSFIPAAFGANDVTNQITGMREGISIELHLKNKKILRGTRGELSASGFTLVDPSAGNSQIAFDEVASVRQITKKSHTTRNVLIGVGIAVVVVAVVVAIGIKSNPLSGSH